MYYAYKLLFFIFNEKYFFLLYKLIVYAKVLHCCSVVFGSWIFEKSFCGWIVFHRYWPGPKVWSRAGC